MAFFEALTAHPSVQFKKDRNFYLKYDGFYLVLFALVLAGFALTGFKPLIGEPSLWFLAAAPVLLFGFIWAHLTIHNCTHGNTPKQINRLLGEVLGLLVVVRFASWTIIHMRHHKYSDDRKMDPHPNFPGFWKTVRNTVLQVEQQLFQQYFDTWGDTPENRQRERRRAYVSYGTNIVLVAAYLWLLGPWFMVLVFAPANFGAGLFVIHFNWSTHNGERGRGDQDFKPVNLNHGLYRLGNKLFCGIYMHANHHTRPHLFNPNTSWNPQLYGAAETEIDLPGLPVPR